MISTPDIVLDKSALRPCVYVFWLGERCQYVGQSKLGVGRPFDSSHHIYTLPGFDFDRVEIHFTDKDALDVVERNAIETLAPQFNITYHPVHKNSVNIRALRNKCEVAMIHEQDRLLLLTLDKDKVSRIYAHALETIIPLVNLR